MKFKSVCISLALFLLVSTLGCSSNGPQNGDEGTSGVVEDPLSTVTTSVGDGAGQMSRKDAGSQYLKIVNGANCAFNAILDFEGVHSLGDGTTDPSFFTEYMTLWKDYAQVLQTVYRELLAAEWPTDVQPEVEILAREWAQRAQSYELLSESVDVGQFNVGVQGFNDSSGVSQANPGYIRALLNLGPSSETDRC